MGRSVSTPSNCQAVARKDTGYFGYDYNDEKQAYDFDAGYSEFQAEDDYDFLKESIIESAQEQWPSFVVVNDKWLGREDRVLLENDLAYIGVSEYCGLTAVWLKSKFDELDGSYYAEEASRAPLSKNFVAQIEAKFMDMFNEYNKVGTFCNGDVLLEKAA